jgi:hypothetical protein
MRYVHHRDRGGEAQLLVEAFRPTTADAASTESDRSPPQVR